MKMTIAIATALLLTISCGNGASVEVTNLLGHETITSLKTSTSGTGWSRNLLQEPLPPEGTHTFKTETGPLSIVATDDQGASYTYEGALTGNGISWGITPEHRTVTAVDMNPWTGPCPVTVTNGLTGAITRVYCSPSSHSGWGESWIDLPLQPGQSATFHLSPDTYDIRVESGPGSSYSRWRLNIGLEGHSWEVRPQHIDSSG